MRLLSHLYPSLAVIALAAGLTMIPVAAMAAPRPVVLELFTSNGCSSCPPAYTLLSALRDDPPVDDVELIVLNEHVDYWDKLGWVDPFSSSAFTQRQRTYARQVFASNQVYTPQLVVDGVAPMVGSRRNEAVAAIRRQATRPSVPVAITVSRLAASRLDIDVRVDPAAVDGAFRVRVALTQDNAVSRVGGGENGGRTLTEDGVVRDWQLARQDSGQHYRAQLTVPADLDERNAAVVAFVQRVPLWHIVGAKRVPVTESGAHAAEYNDLVRR